MDELYGFNILDNITVYILKAPIATISEINPSGRDVTFRGSTSTENNTVDRYIWRSSVYGVFYNNSANPITALNFSVGNHTIWFKIRDSYGRYSPEVTVNITVLNIVVIETPEEETTIWYNDGGMFSSVITTVIFMSVIGILLIVGIFYGFKSALRIHRR